MLELLELLPHAAMPQPVTSTASASGARRLAISKILIVWSFRYSSGRSSAAASGAEQRVDGGAGAPGAAEPPEPPELELALLAPESLTDVALIAPFEFRPRMTTVSPGRTADLPTVTFLVILVALESVTLSVLPEVSVT